MKQQKYFYILAFLLVGLSLNACQNTRQTNVSANAGDAQKEQSKSETGQASSEKSPEAVKPEKPEKADARKNIKAESDDVAESKDKVENRCGWYENPTPGNHWLIDKDGEWIIGTQGGDQAEGDYPPEFSDAQWVKTNINYGYGCACLRVIVDKKEMQIKKVVSGTARPLSVCRKDKALREPME